MNPENNTGEVKSRLLPGKVSLAGAALVSCLLTVSAAVSFCAYDLPSSMLAFVAASALLSFFLVFVRHPIAVTVPVIVQPPAEKAAPFFTVTSPVMVPLYR